jgi:signal transduction histidine kinase
VSAHVDRLVAYAERIAREDLDFKITPATDDEFGWLARKLEEMRARLVASRSDLERAHADRVNSEKMAALGRVAAGIIHDFKNPMSVIRGTAELIEARAQQNEKLGKQCQTIRQQVDRMTSLTRDVLEYTSGKSFLEPEAVELGAFLEELRAFHAESFARAGVKLEIEVGDPLRVLLDPSRMRRVLDNVVVNALEVSRVGDRVRVRGAVTPDGGVRLEIIDQGPGIPAAVLARVFEPFVTSGKEGGTGLGLAIARKIVEDHSGTIEARNDDGGKGARFTITLPEKLRFREGEPVVQESAV